MEISGVDAGRFQAVSGLGDEIEVIEFQDGDDLVLRKRPGRVRFDDVTLKKGYIVTNDLRRWWQAASKGQFERRSISIILCDAAGISTAAGRDAGAPGYSTAGSARWCWS